MILLLWVLVFIASLFVLVKASDYFTDSAEKIGLFLGIPAFIVGVTIVAIGTSLPELISSIFAVLRNSSEIVVANVVGSNITNIFLVLGVAAIVSRKKLKVTYELIHVDLPIFIGSAFLLAAMIYDGVFTFIEALICLFGLIVYFSYAAHTQKQHKDVETQKEVKDELKEVKKELRKETKPKTLGWKIPLTLVISAVLIYFGAKYVVDSIIALSNLLNVGKEIIAASALALGTSLPELTVSITAARKGNAGIAIGNVLGSNIFNTFGVMSIPAFIGTLIIPHSIITFALPMMVIASLLYFFITQDREITRWEGWLLIMFYVFFIVKLFGWV